MVVVVIWKTLHSCSLACHARCIANAGAAPVRWVPQLSCPPVQPPACRYLLLGGDAEDSKRQFQRFFSLVCAQKCGASVAATAAAGAAALQTTVLA